MRKLLFLFFFALSFLSAAEYTAIVNNKNSIALKNFPVVLKVNFNANLGDCAKILVKDQSGNNVIAQWDDFNNNSKFDMNDEVALLANLAPGVNKFIVTLLPGKKLELKPLNNDKSLWVTIDNGIVKLALHKEKISLRNFFFMQQKKWLNVASYFVLEPKMDDSWKWQNKQYNVSLAANGKVRKVIVMEVVKENIETNKVVKITNRLSIFANRHEILSQQIIENVSYGQVVQVNTVNSGMYQVFNQVSNKNIHFAGINNRSKIVKGSLASGSFLLKNPTVNQAIWCNVFSGNLSFGIAIPKSENLANLLIRTIPKTKTIRMSLLHQPIKNVIWPNKSLVFDYWFVTQNTSNKAIESFAKNIKSLSGELLR